MATAIHEDFSHWLDEKLQELNTDETIFGSYIRGILDSDETIDEKNDALQGILSEIITNENDISEICSEILEKWQFFKPKEPPPSNVSSEEMNLKLVKLMESQSLATTKQKEYTEEERKIKQAILSQYSEMTDDEQEDEDTTVAGSGGSDHIPKENGLEKNTNVQSVLQAEKVKREQARLDSQRKKEKDKEDREKQKQQREEKKEKRKTQKNEKRR